MNRNDLKEFKDRLLEIQRAVGKRSESLVAAMQDEEVPPGEHELHVVPSGSVESDLAMEQAEERIGQQVLGALARIEQGTFGQCEECGKPIAKARLAALPYAALCIQCERQNEEQKL